MAFSRARIAAALLLVATSPQASADSIRCEGGIVATGDTKLDLLGKCGEPTLRERSVVERASALDDEAGNVRVELRSAVTVDRWTYDLGRNRFVQTVTIEDGRIVAVERSGRGYADGPRTAVRVPMARCDPSALREGASKLHLLARCGEPALREQGLERRTVLRRGGDVALEAATTVQVETWTYDFGVHRFVVLVRLEDGVVARLERASYGYAR